MDVILVRDLDSEISHREISAYNEFSYSEKKFHIMRDHPNHGVAILGPILDGKLDTTKFLDSFLNDVKTNFFS